MHASRCDAAPWSGRGFEAGDTDAVVALWEACELTRPWNDPYRDVERKVAVDDGMFLVGTIDGVVVASVMGGYDGHRGWVNYLAVAPERRGGGSARALMAEVEARLRAAGCPKVNLQVRDTNAAVVAFYERLGYRVEPVTSLGLRLEPDDARSGRRRDGSAADTAP